jgi:DNA-binding NtrC family response regulator
MRSILAAPIRAIRVLIPRRIPQPAAKFPVKGGDLLSQWLDFRQLLAGRRGMAVALSDVIGSSKGRHMETTMTETSARPLSLDDRLRAVEASLIGWALKETRGNKSKAAQLLRIKRSTLGDRINRCGLGRRSNEHA